MTIDPTRVRVDNNILISTEASDNTPAINEIPGIITIKSRNVLGGNVDLSYAYITI
jgi:hypothetical protein